MKASPFRRAPAKSAFVRWGAVISALLLLAAAGFTALSLRRYDRRPASSRWPSTDGVVRSAYVEEIPRRYSKLWALRVDYDYAVAGRAYRGTRYDFRGSDTTEHAKYLRWVAAHPPGTRLRVFYDPRDPSAAVLDPKAVDSGPHLQGFAGFGVGLLALAWLVLCLLHLVFGIDVGRALSRRACLRCDQKLSYFMVVPRCASCGAENRYGFFLEGEWANLSLLSGGLTGCAARVAFAVVALVVLLGSYIVWLALTEP